MISPRILVPPEPTEVPVATEKLQRRGSRAKTRVATKEVEKTEEVHSAPSASTSTANEKAAVPVVRGGKRKAKLPVLKDVEERS